MTQVPAQFKEQIARKTAFYTQGRKAKSLNKLK